MKWPFARASRTNPPPSRAPEGEALYAVGDIHGRADLLDGLLRTLLQDIDALPAEVRPTLVFLGDYVDRGPASRQVIDRLVALPGQTRAEVVCLRGNHEQALTDFLADPASGPAWAEFGGDATLRSYGVEPPRLRTDSAAWVAAQAAFAAVVPARHLDWLRRLPLSFSAGDYAFVHAGVRPGAPLEQQQANDLLWIREPFLSYEGRHPQVVVHGHTPTERPHLGPWRIGLDTGAYATGRLCAIRLQGEERRLMGGWADAGPPARSR